MASKIKQKSQSALFKARCKQLLEQGMPVSKIAKILGDTYRHTAHVCAQIKEGDYDDQ